MVFRKFIPNPEGDLTTVTAAGNVNVSGLKTMHTNLDTEACPYGMKIGDPSPTLSEDCFPGYGVGNRELQGRMRTGKK